MAMAWTENLSVGVNAIDEQHKTLFQKADQLFEAGRSNQSAAFIEEMLNFLDDYTKEHFRNEETYMQSIQYPAYDVQKKLHTEFLDKLADIKKEFKASGGNTSVIMNANQLVSQWLIKHISVEDKKIGVFARSL